MKKYSINEFFKGNVDIRCKTAEQQEIVLRECDKRGVVWNSGHPATDRMSNSYPVLEINYWHNGRLTHGVGQKERNIVDFDQIDFTERNSYQITIDCDGTTTTATMTINGREVKTAIARRNQADKFDWKKGAELAFERLWGSLRKLGEKPEVREVDRWAKPGEYIKIVNAFVGYGEGYRNGDIFRVTEYYQGIRNGWVSVKGTNIAMSPNEYVVLEGYRP